jgi:hypothetical protein
MKYIVEPKEDLCEGYCDCSNCQQGYNSACPNQMAYCTYYVSSSNAGINSDNGRTVVNVIKKLCFWN